MEKYTAVKLESIEITRVLADNDPSGARQAFEKLESKMDSLRGRRMFGLFYTQTGKYYACVQLDEKHPGAMGFEKSTIPAGLYAQRKLLKWHDKISQLPILFENLEAACLRNKLQLDQNRPNIEFYRSNNELVIMVPVIGYLKLRKELSHGQGDF